MPNDHPEPQQDPAARGGNANPDNREHAQKIPPETQPAEEWGERLDTGRTIASGGKDKGPTKDEP